MRSTFQTGTGRRFGEGTRPGFSASANGALLRLSIDSSKAMDVQLGASERERYQPVPFSGLERRGRTVQVGSGTLLIRSHDDS